MNKKTLILGGLLVVLIALAYVYQGPLKKWQNNLGKPQNILAKIDITKIDKMKITSGGKTIVLSKPSNVLAAPASIKWKYNNAKDFYADPGLTSSALERLKQAASSEPGLISNSQARKSEFKTDGAGLNVKIYQAEKKVADFTIGNRAGYSGSYISAPESPATYLVKADLRGVFEPAEWRDLTIFSTAESALNKIRFQYPNREFTVELKSDKWSGILPEKFTVNQEKIDKISRLMSDLKAREIPEQTFDNTGLDKHLIIIEASGEGVDNVLMIGENQNGLYYAKKGDSDNIYLIDKSARDELDKWIWQLR